MKNFKGTRESLVTLMKFLTAGALTKAQISEVAKAQKINVTEANHARLLEKEPELANFASELGIVGKAKTRSAGGSGSGKGSGNFGLILASHPTEAAIIKQVLDMPTKVFDVTLEDGTTGQVAIQVAFKRADEKAPKRADRKTESVAVAV